MNSQGCAPPSSGHHGRLSLRLRLPCTLCCHTDRRPRVTVLQIQGAAVGLSCVPGRVLSTSEVSPAWRSAPRFVSPAVPAARLKSHEDASGARGPRLVLPPPQPEPRHPCRASVAPRGVRVAAPRLLLMSGPARRNVRMAPARSIFSTSSPCALPQQHSALLPTFCIMGVKDGLRCRSRPHICTEVKCRSVLTMLR